MGLFGRRSRSRDVRPTEDDQPPTAPVPRPESASALWAHGLGRVGTRSLQVLAILTVVAVGVFALTRVTLIVIPVLLALVLAAAISPLVSFLRRRTGPRSSRRRRRCWPWSPCCPGSSGSSSPPW